MADTLTRCNVCGLPLDGSDLNKNPQTRPHSYNYTNYCLDCYQIQLTFNKQWIVPVPKPSTVPAQPIFYTDKSVKFNPSSYYCNNCHQQVSYPHDCHSFDLIQNTCSHTRSDVQLH